MVDTKT